MAEAVLPAAYSPPAGLLSGRVILITGAGDGLGRAAALAAARHGATVVLLGRTVSRLERVYDELVGAGASQPAICPANLLSATWSELAQIPAMLEREFGVLHGLVHCAARFSGFVPLAQLDPQDWLDTLQVNLTAPFALTHHCMPLLRKADGASVVFVTDSAGRTGKAFSGPYGVSKAGLDALARIWAQETETQRTPRFNSIDPGPMNTAMRRRGYVGDTGDLSEPEAIAPALLWLLGPDSAGVTGRSFSARP